MARLNLTPDEKAAAFTAVDYHLTSRKQEIQNDLRSGEIQIDDVRQQLNTLEPLESAFIKLRDSVTEEN